MLDSPEQEAYTSRASSRIEGGDVATASCDVGAARADTTKNVLITANLNILTDLSDSKGNTESSQLLLETCLHFFSFSSSRFFVLAIFFLARDARTSTAIVSTLPERITIAAFYPRRERGPRTFLKFWWPPPGGPRLPPGYNPYELLVLLQAVVPFVSCASLVDAPPHRWSFSTGSPLRVPVCLLRSFVYTTGVLAPDKPAPYVCVMRTQAHIRENARGRGRGREKRDGENERKMMCTYAPLASSSGSRSNRGRRFDTGQRHWKYRYQW